MKTKIAQKIQQSPRFKFNPMAPIKKEPHGVQSVVLDFNKQILTSLQVKEADRKKWDPVLQWFREVLIAWALANTKDVATSGVLSDDDNKQLLAAVFRISGILRGASPFNSKTSGGLEGYIGMKEFNPLAQIAWSQLFITCSTPVSFAPELTKPAFRT